MNAEQLAAWYFRLNGFFTITNFVLHPSRRGAQRTDADIAGIRFPYRSEFPDGVGGDDPEFNHHPGKTYFVIAEVKRGRCVLNGPWTDEMKQNMHAILGDLGPFRKEDIESVAHSLYQSGTYDDNNIYCSLFCVGDIPNPEIAQKYPNVPQRSWEDVCHFLFDRFKEYQFRKADHDSWDQYGKNLWDSWLDKTREQFVANIRHQIGLNPTA